MAKSAGGDEHRCEDGEVVSCMHKGRTRDRVRFNTHVTEGETYAVENAYHAPGIAYLGGVHDSEGNAGEESRDHQGGRGVGRASLPAVQTGWGTRKGHPVIGGREGWKKEATESYLFHDGAEDDA